MKHGRDILGLCFDDGRLSAVRVDAAGAVLDRLSVALSVDPLADDPQLVAQELRERLQPLGKPARTAVACLPLNRVMVTTVALPELPDDAVQGFLLLQAEREFLLPPAELVLGVSRYTTEDGKRGAFLAGLPVSLYTNLQRALRLIGLKQLHVTLSAVARAADPGAAAPSAFLMLGATTADFGVTAGGGIVLLRRLASNPPEAHPHVFDVPALLREVRIATGQLSPSVRRDLRAVELQGAGADIARLTGTPVPGLPHAVWQTTAGTAVNANTDANDLPTERAERAATCVAAAQPLALPLAPVVTATGGFLQRWTRRQLITAATGPALLCLLVIGLVVYQHVQISLLRKRWQAMEPRTVVVRNLIAEAKTRRSWATDQPETLVLLRALSDAFPKRGTVWATRLEVRERRDVAIAGKAVNREAWLEMLDSLRRLPGITSLRVADLHDSGDGRTPLTFALGFRWQPVPAGQPETPRTNRKD